MPPETRLPFSLSPQGRRAVRVVAILAAVVGALLGLETLVLHLTSDPLADARIYYEAGARLNAGLPLYNQGSETGVGFYVYPPLVAVLFRPLALLPFPAAAAIWEAGIVASLVMTVRRIGLDARLLVVLGWLALPICWALSVGQAEPVLTLLLTIGTPATVALAGHIKIVPWLVATYWLGKGDRRALTRFAAWVLGFSVLQLLVEPAGTMAFLHLESVGPAFEVRNISLFALSPLAWAVTAGALIALALRLARTRWGWPAAVVLTVVANPRLLVYQLMSLLAAFGGRVDETEPTA